MEPPVLPGLLGPEGSPLRRTRTILAFILAVLLVVAVVLAVLGAWLPLVWTFGIAVVFVVGHLWSWPRRDGRPDPQADLTLSARAGVATGVTVGAASGFAIVIQGGSAGQGLLQAVVTTVIAVPALLAAGWWQRRRTTS